MTELLREPSPLFIELSAVESHSVLRTSPATDCHGRRPYGLDITTDEFRGFHAAHASQHHTLDGSIRRRLTHIGAQSI
jgi:hypothetical protein